MPFRRLVGGIDAHHVHFQGFEVYEDTGFALWGLQCLKMRANRQHVLPPRRCREIAECACFSEENSNLDDFEILRFSLLSSILGASSPWPPKAPRGAFEPHILFTRVFQNICACPFPCFRGRGWSRYSPLLLSAQPLLCRAFFRCGVFCSLEYFAAK